MEFYARIMPRFSDVTLALSLSSILEVFGSVENAWVFPGVVQLASDKKNEIDSENKLRLEFQERRIIFSVFEPL